MSSVSSRISTDRRISDAEGWAVLLFCTAASAIAIVWSWRHDAMLNYGDAIAHLHIARRVLDSRTPRFTQLGSVWLPLPHILLLPFVQDYRWWATGLGAVIPSALSYIASCAGLYRLARRWLSPGPAAITLLFFALNPNLLYLQTTAMTEPLFICEVIWIVVWIVEWRATLNNETESGSFNLPPAPSIHTASRSRIDTITSTSRLQFCIAAGLVAAIFTRYDGWIIALIAWTGIGLTLLRRAAKGERGRLSSPAFWLPTIAVVAAPILWFIYNSVGFGDWLFFARGPYSARAIELRTASGPPGSSLHPGWHNPWVALLFYIKVSELDSVAAPAWGSLWGNVILALAAAGTAFTGFARKPLAGRRVFSWLLLLWLPIPFYAWSVAYGSVPIFFPAWWPHSWYNTRYGLELLPALALGLGFTAQLTADALSWVDLSRFVPCAPSLARIQQLLPTIALAVFFLLAGYNVSALLRNDPIVYIEGTKNLEARLRYDSDIPPLLQQLLALFPRAPVLMNTSVYPEIVSLTGIPLRQTINESDLEIFRAALAAPSKHAAIIVAFDGDDIDQAVRAHPEDLDVAAHFTASGQPSATIYLSTWWIDQSPLWKKLKPSGEKSGYTGTEASPK